jgi:GNAT superfamily N-acetyltransferase
VDDLLVALEALPPLAPVVDALVREDVRIVRPVATDRRRVLAWVQRHFGPIWRDECDVALGCVPATCRIAMAGSRLCGFACFDVAALGMLGPLGVAPAYRSRGVGRGLVLSALHALRQRGHAYAVIGSVARDGREFYARVAGASVIPGSTHRRLRTGPRDV